MVLKFQRRLTGSYMECPIFVLFHEERFCFYGIMWQNTTMRPRSISVSVTNALCMVESSSKTLIAQYSVGYVNPPAIAKASQVQTATGLQA